MPGPFPGYRPRPRENGYHVLTDCPARITADRSRFKRLAVSGIGHNLTDIADTSINNLRSCIFQLNEETVMDRKDKEARDANRDPISGAPGAHPVGVGLG